MNPYGGYGPAQALKDTGDSLADMMKSLLAVKIQNAQLDVEGKKFDLETAKTKGGLEKDISLAQLATEKDLADIRHKGQELEVKRAQQESEAGYRDRVAGVYERNAAVHEGDLGMKQREEARLNHEDTVGNLIMGSNLPSAVKQVMKSTMDPEELGRKTTVRKFKEGVEDFFVKNPSVMLGGMVMGLGVKIRQAEAKVRGAKSQEEVNAIFENELEPAAYHMMELRMMLGDGPDMTEKDHKTFAELGMKAYAANPENYKDEADAIQRAVASGTQLKKAYWEEKFPSPEKRKEKAMKSAGFKKEPAEEEIKSAVTSAVADYKANAKKWKGRESAIDDKIRTQYGEAAADEFLLGIGKKRPVKKEAPKATEAAPVVQTKDPLAALVPPSLDEGEDQLAEYVRKRMRPETIGETWALE